MTSELFIENYRLDITNEISSLITFELDNIKNFATRSTTWSKTIIIPGTANNNKLFGHIFQVGQNNSYTSTLPNVNYNFNASKSADCIIFQDQLQTFRGVLRLLQINTIKGRTEFEVAVFGKLASLNVALSAGLLEDLDFSAYDHVYSTANIINSWNNAGGSGYYYPLIDCGTYSVLKHDWDIRTFRPALYVREYLDKMFTAAHFRWSSDLLNTQRFKSLIVPHNKKLLTSNNTNILNASRVTPTQTVIDYGSSATNPLGFPVFAGALFTPSGSPVTRFTYNGADTINLLLSWDLTYTWHTLNNTIAFELRKNGTAIATRTLFNTGGITLNGEWRTNQNVTFATNDYIEFWVTVSDSSFGHFYSFRFDYGTLSGVSATTIAVPIAIGDTVQMNSCLPRNIRQLDFLVSIVKLFNLYVYEDKFDTSLIYLKPYVDFYDGPPNAIDWTYKLNRDKNIAVKPMSELNARKYEFKYKSDSDYYNELYKKRYNEGYGNYVYDSLYEFAQTTEAFEIIFSSTPLVGYSGEEKVYPTIFKRTGPDATAIEELTDSNIRIMQSLKVTGVAAWDIKDGVTVLDTNTFYGYAGHFDNPDLPSNDLNFGALKELFFILSTGDLSVTQFNVYWSTYMAEITDKDSKLLSAWFYLTPKDIVLLDFSKLIYIDGILFRLNKIGDYNVSNPTDCLVELFKVGYTNYFVPPSEFASFLLWTDGDTEIINWSDTNQGTLWT